MRFCMGSHALPVEQGRLARQAIPRHLRRCTLCETRALGDERHFVVDCPHFAHIRRRFRSLYQDADIDGTMQCSMWHKEQRAVCHCLAAIHNLADRTSEILSLSLPLSLGDERHSALFLIVPILPTTAAACVLKNSCLQEGQLSRAAICACLATGVCVGSVTLLWVMRGTCSWSALLLQISETSTLHCRVLRCHG